MTFDSFEEWWDADALTQTNPYRDDTPAYWAWEGWRAGAKSERKACAETCQKIIDGGEYDGRQQYAAAACRDAITARSN